jgi:sialate O-acetylesterase
MTHAAVRLSRHVLRLALPTTALVALPSAHAQPASVPDTSTALRFARLFSDGVVLQRGAPIPVWGWAPRGTAMTVSLHGHAARAIADSTGRWMVSLPAERAGGPYTLTATGGGTTLTVRDILVGDVWVASGQSNMELEVMTAAHAAQEIAAAHDSSLRQFKVPVSWAEQPLGDVTGGSWAPADSAHVGRFSAVAYYFAREIRKDQHVPIGIVNTTWGGSAIETWMSTGTQGLAADAPSRLMATERARLDTERAQLEARLGGVPERDPGLVDGTAPWADPTLADSAWKTIAVPALWESQGYDGMDGVAWYRTTFTLSADEAARVASLSLGTIDDDDITWVNGVEVGRTTGYNVPRHYAIPASTLHAGPNVLAVRVMDYGGGGGIYGAPDSVRLDVGGAARPLAGTWRFRVGTLAMSMDGQRINKVPAVTYNAMVRPLLPMPIKGVIWYQGESNANDAQQAIAYRDQFRKLITSWRAAFTNGTRGAFPFLWVQLPNFGTPDATPVAQPAWALQRESMDAALALPNTGRAVTIDIGEPNDIHPKNKQDVGKRLALVGRRVAYGEAVESSGPTYASHVVRGDSVIVSFAHAAGGLATHASDGASVGAFAVAGADHRFVWAHARIDGNRVVVWGEQVPNPVAVRYAWANNPADANLYGKTGLPAAPFRTDKW